jgi:hypothetical protein
MLNEEIESASRLVKTDAYQMSVGEIVNMYKDGELQINPDFQRLFRWQIGQKAKLIESILLGIPLPSIFVFEREDSKWELVDGLQRISTILEFMGELKKPETTEKYEATTLVATKYLPSLNNLVWKKSDIAEETPEIEQNALTAPQQLTIKRCRISVEILKRPSDEATKYDLFQRLNSGGIAANPQELRNCITIMVNRSYAEFLKSLAELDVAKTVLAISEEQIEKQKNMEYVSRFMVHTYVPYDGKLDVEEYIDEGIVKLALECEMQKSGSAFRDTFTFLNNALGGNSLRRIQNGEHVGRIGLAAFECIAVGIAKNIQSIRAKPDPVEYVRQRIEEFWNLPDSGQFYAQGLRGTVRIQRTVTFGSDWFST